MFSISDMFFSVIPSTKSNSRKCHLEIRVQFWTKSPSSSAVLQDSSHRKFFHFVSSACSFGIAGVFFVTVPWNDCCIWYYRNKIQDNVISACLSIQWNWITDQKVHLKSMTVMLLFKNNWIYPLLFLERGSTTMHNQRLIKHPWDWCSGGLSV